MTRRKLSPPKPRKRPKKVKNPVAALLSDPAFRPQKVKNPGAYTRRVKHKKIDFRDSENPNDSFKG